MTTYTYSQARQNFAAVLEKAKKEGKVLIKKRDGSSFILAPIPNAESPFNVKGIHTNISSDEIIDILKEVKERQ
jgi:hypothetical protein